MRYLKRLSVLLATAAIMTGCGGGGGGGVTTYGGSTTAATIDSTNAEALSKSSSEAAVNGKNADEVRSNNAFKSGKAVVELAKTTTLEVLQQETIPGFCDSGSVDVSGSATSATITYSNCEISSFWTTDVFVFNGTATYTGNSTGSEYTFQYINFSISINGVVDTIENFTIECTSYGATCTIYTDFVGSDGVVYRFEDFNGYDGWDGYYISGRFYHPDHGYVDMRTTTGISFSDCSGTQRPTAGTYTLTSGTGTIEVTFNSCTQFTIVVNGGAAQLINW